MIVHSLLQAFFLSLLSFAASQEMLDLNPDLGPFQDDRECFPFTKSWRLIYRDFEEDPFMGGKSKCVRAVETGEFVNDGTLVMFQYPPDGVINTTFKLMSSPGYTAKNVLNVQLADQPGTNMNLTISFRDCHSCKVIRHSYINEGKGCSLWVTEDEMDLPHPCCSFVFELLCGFNPTYQIYDESCH